MPYNGSLCARDAIDYLNKPNFEIEIDSVLRLLPQFPDKELREFFEARVEANFSEDIAFENLLRVQPLTRYNLPKFSASSIAIIAKALYSDVGLVNYVFREPEFFNYCTTPERFEKLHMFLVSCHLASEAQTDAERNFFALGSDALSEMMLLKLANDLRWSAAINAVDEYIGSMSPLLLEKFLKHPENYNYNNYLLQIEVYDTLSPTLQEVVHGLLFQNVDSVKPLEELVRRGNLGSTLGRMLRTDPRTRRSRDSSPERPIRYNPIVK